VKAIAYRSIIVCLDFLVVYLLTGKLVTAAAFMLVSNIYTTVAYFFYERVWARIQWGMEPQIGD
jgi:adenylylsulfate kinase